MNSATSQKKADFAEDHADSTKKTTVDRISQRIENSRHQLIGLGALSFLESTILPIPLELVLIPFLVVHRDRIWRTSMAVLVGCLLGALVGYGCGALLPESWGDTLRSWFGSGENTGGFEERFRRNGFFAILSVGVTPVPFQIAMLNAGASGYPILLYLAAVLISRGLRYFGLALLVHFFGESAEKIWRKNKLVAGLIAFALIAVLFGLSKLLESAM